MKKLQTIMVLVLCAALLFACSDNSQTDDTPQTASYSVTVCDPAGNPWSGNVIVHFVSNGQTVAMQTLDANGVAQKELEKGDYTVTLAFTDGSDDYHYDESAAVLTAEKTSTQLVLAKQPVIETRVESSYSADTGETTEITVNTFYVSEGYTRIELQADQRNYFYFAPVRGGVYRVCVLGADATVGYYGSQHFIQDNSVAEPAEDGSISVNVTESMVSTGSTGTAVLVIGVDSADSVGYLCIERVGDPEKTVADYDWVIYKSLTKPEAFTLPSDVALKNFDLTAAGYELVFNEADGCYHVGAADGPVVYFRLGSESEYLDSIQTILESSGINCYYYDEDGSFIEKVSFSECLMEYIACMDPVSGVYPLTEDLIHIIQERGKYVGWYDPSNSIYLFKDDDGNTIPGINQEISWLFNCCYGEVEKEPDNSGSGSGNNSGSGNTSGSTGSTNTVIYTDPEQSTSTPGYTVVSPDSYNVGTDSGTKLEVNYYNVADTMSYDFSVPAGQYINVDFYRLTGMFMTIRSEDVYVIYNGKVYLPVNGVLSFELIFSSTNMPCSVSIGNAGTSDLTFEAGFASELGDYMNPESLAMGQFTTRLEKGDENGYYYTYTATSAGTLTVKLYSITRGTECEIQLSNSNSYAVRTLSESDDYTVSIEVEAGDVVTINIGVTTKNYPASTVVAIASFE